MIVINNNIISFCNCFLLIWRMKWESDVLWNLTKSFNSTPKFMYKALFYNLQFSMVTFLLGLRCYAKFHRKRRVTRRRGRCVEPESANSNQGSFITIWWAYNKSTFSFTLHELSLSWTTADPSKPQYECIYAVCQLFVTVIICTAQIHLHLILVRRKCVFSTDQCNTNVKNFCDSWIVMRAVKLC